MKKLYILSVLLLISLIAYPQASGVGVGTTDPQQKLHLGSSTGTIRVDGLNSPNSPYNAGGFDKTFPLYVNDNGDLTLALSTFMNSDGTDAITSSTPLVATTLSMAAGSAPAGSRELVILPYTITVNRTAILEVKYSISFEVLKNSTTKVKDLKPRNITTFYTLDTPTLLPTTQRYGQAAKCYYNNNDLAGTPVNAAQGLLYNCSTTYVTLTPGTHTLRFYGTLATGTTSIDTYINFAIGNDSIFMRLY
nr:hypothetical protein [uncultured Flavobacterium sp.]